MDMTTGSSGIGGVSSVSDKNNSAMSQDLSVLLSEMSVGVDRRAPGCEKKVVQIATADYEHKKLLATKAMQHKPMGEPRTPNSVWSGWLVWFLSFWSSCSLAWQVLASRAPCPRL